MSESVAARQRGPTHWNVTVNFLFGPKPGRAAVDRCAVVAGRQPDSPTLHSNERQRNEQEGATREVKRARCVTPKRVKSFLWLALFNSSSSSSSSSSLP